MIEVQSVSFLRHLASRKRGDLPCYVVWSFVRARVYLLLGQKGHGGWVSKLWDLESGVPQWFLKSLKSEHPHVLCHTCVIFILFFSLDLCSFFVLQWSLPFLRLLSSLDRLSSLIVGICNILVLSNLFHFFVSCLCDALSFSDIHHLLAGFGFWFPIFLSLLWSWFLRNALW